tara:strand:- start:5191 stop:5871 length:681 start_codon:yes stop_codon:yes gene_type:complete
MSKASNLSGFVPSIGPTNNLSVGIITATTFDGNITGVAATFTGDITGVNATFSSNVTIGGTLTYEDVTNIDSVGLITARTGINVLAGGIDAVGVVTATSFSGDGSALAGVANTDFINAEQVNVVGVVTATTGLDGVIYSGVSTTATSKTVVNREFCEVTAASQTITLPASPTVGHEVYVAIGNFTDTVVARNGSNIMSLAEDMTLDVAYKNVKFVYVNSTIGWRIN